MTITRADVADLQPGDVVEISGYPIMNGAICRGPLWAGEEQKLCVGPFIVRHRDGSVATQYEDDDEFTLTVVSRVPRLYVNHPRPEPVPGDVAKDADGNEPSAHTWHYLGDEERAHWWRFDDHLRDGQPARLRLLVDGETGRCVP